MGALGTIGKLLLGIDLVRGGWSELSGLAAASLGDAQETVRKDGQTFKVTRANVRTMDERVQRIVQLARKAKRDPSVQQAVARLLNRKCGDRWCVPEKDEAAELKAIYEGVRKKVRYMKDPRGVDTFRHPRHTLKSVEEGGFAGGDCDDSTLAVVAYCEAAGYPTKLRIMAIKPDPPRAYSHIAPLVGIPARAPTKWICMDASVDKFAGWYPTGRVSGFKDYEVPA